MTKAKITIEATIEYDIKPENYPPNFTLDNCLKMDIANANEDTLLFLEMDNCEMEITGELLESE